MSQHSKNISSNIGMLLFLIPVQMFRTYFLSYLRKVKFLERMIVI